MGIKDYLTSKVKDKREVVEDKPSNTEEKLNDKLTDIIKEQSQKAWGNPENDGTLREIGSGFFRLREEEFFKISRSLERWNSVFYKFWELGRPVFTRTIPTAAVAFDEEGNCVNFIFNPDFWMAMDPYTREFIICHEMLHVILNHGVRTRSARGMSENNQHAVNATLDVVINHSLCEKFDFVRDKIDEQFSKGGCWIDTIYEKPEEIEPDRAYEYYFNRLPVRESGEGDGDGKGKGGKGKGKGKKGKGQKGKGEPGEGNGDGEVDHMDNPYGNMVDDHGGLNQEELKEAIDQLDDSLTDEEKEGLKDLIDQHFEQGDEGDDPAKDKRAGKGALGKWHFADMKAVKKKKKWETVIKKWIKKRLKIERKDKEQWACPHRRNALLGKELMLPSEMEVEDNTQDKSKIEVWAFQDTSGSCSGFMDRFFKCMRTIPAGKYDPFKVRLFCFDTKVYPASLEEGKLRGGGGTCFKVIEKSIQETMNKEGIKYPDSVWIVTDGWGTHVNPEKPERWHFFLSESNDSCVPKESDRHLLKDFE